MVENIYFINVGRWHEAYLKKKLEGKAHTINFVRKKEDVEKECTILSMFIDTKIDADFLKNHPNLKMIATLSTGFDHIDIKECKKRKISVATVPVYGEHTIAEFTFALILHMTRNLYKLRLIENMLGEETLSSVENNLMMGTDIYQKTLGIIGTGHIGQHVIKIANGFGMNVIAYDAYPNNKLKESLNFEYNTLNNLLKKSDIITIHVPLLKGTYHLINKNNINKIKKGAIIINTARGEIIETESLIKGIKSKRIAKIGLDVIEYEKLIKSDFEFGNLTAEEIKGVLLSHNLISLPNVIYTSHNGFNTKEAVERIMDTATDNILSYLNNKPKNLIK